MFRRCLAVCACAFVTPMFACSSSSSGGTAPVISNLTIPSPVAAGGAIACELDATDTAGLEDLSVTFTVSSDGQMLATSTQPLQDGTSADSGTFSLVISASGIPAGTYSVTLSLTQGSATSNELTGTFVLE